MVPKTQRTTLRAAPGIAVDQGKLGTSVIGRGARTGTANVFLLLAAAALSSLLATTVAFTGSTALSLAREG